MFVIKSIVMQINGLDYGSINSQKASPPISLSIHNPFINKKIRNTLDKRRRLP